MGSDIEDAQLLNDKSVAQLLCVSPGTLKSWRHRKQGPPYIRLGKSTRYRRTAVVAWLAQQEVDPGLARRIETVNRIANELSVTAKSQDDAA
jgi:predicted DNA-binding transcriptional regulator AlpA